MVNPTASKANSTQRLIQRLPATFCSANNAKTHKTLNSLSSSALWSLITTQIAKKKTCKPDFLSQQKVPKASSATTKASKEKNLHNTEPKNAFFMATTTSRGTLSETKSLIGAPQHCNVPNNNKNVFHNFSTPPNSLQNTRRGKAERKHEFPRRAGTANL